MRKYIPLIFIALAVLVSNSLYAQWQNLNGPPVSSVVKIVSEVNSQKAYALVNNELYATTNEGVSWQKLNTPSYVYDILLDGTTLYFSDYARLYKSTDGGANWTLPSENYTYSLQYLKRVAVNTFVAYNSYYGVKITKDGGVTWQEVSNNSNGNIGYGGDKVAVNTAGDIYFLTDQGLKRHLNPGAGAWSPANVELVEAGYSNYGSLAAQGNNIYYAYGSDFLKSASGSAGTFASVINNITDTQFYGYWSLAPNNALYFINNNNRKIYSTTSANAGSTWTTLTTWPSTDFSNAAINSLAFINSIKFYAATDGDGIFLSANTGTSYAARTGGINKGYLRKIKVTASGRIIVLAGNNSYGYWYSDDNGANWTYQNMGSYLSYIEDIHLTDQNTLLLFNSNTVVSSVDDATTWQQSFTTVYRIASKPDGTLYGGAYSGAFRTSTDNGATWDNITLTGIPTTNSYLYEMAIDAGGKIYVRVNVYDGVKWVDEFYNITMTGALTGTATLLETPFDDDNEDFKAIFVNNNKLYLASNKNIYYSQDEGGLWDGIAVNNEGVHNLPGGIGVSTYGSFYVTQDDGKTWNSSTLPTSNSSIFDITTNSSGEFLAAPSNSAVLKFNGQLIVDPSTLPPYIDFDWQPLEGPYGGSVSKLFQDGSSNLFAVGNQSVYRKPAPGSAPWTKVNLPDINTLRPATNGTNDLYATNYYALSRSTDGGQTFTTSYQSPGWYESLQDVHQFTDGSLVLNVQRYDFVLNQYQRQIVRSLDGGLTLEATPSLILPTVSPRMTIEITPTDGLYVYYYDQNTSTAIVYRSLDKGQNWTTLTLPPISGNQSFLFSSDHLGNLYITNYNETYKSIDGGDNWTSIAVDPQETRAGGPLAVSPIDNSLFIQTQSLITGRYTIVKSTDDGVSWTKFNDYDFRIESFLPTPTGLIIASQEGVKIISNDGTTISDYTQGISGLTPDDIELLSANSLGITAQGLIQVSSDFNTFTVNPTERARYFYKRSSGSVLSFDCYYLQQTYDGGQTWESYDVPSCLSYADSYDDATFVFGSSGQLYSTVDFTNWNNLNVSGLPSSYNIRSVAAYANDLIYITINNYQNNKSEFYKVEFSNAILLNVAQEPQQVHSIGNTLLVYDRLGAIFESTDGETWVQKGAPSQGNSFRVAENGYYFILSNAGALWLSRDAGQTWQSVGIPQSEGSAFVDVIVNEYDGYAYAALTNSVVRKSANIILPPETAAPLLTSFEPNATTEESLRPTLSLTFNEAVKPKQGKKIKIFDLAAPTVPVITLDAQDNLAWQDDKSFFYELPEGQSLDFNKTYFVSVDLPTAGNGTFEDIFSNNYAGITNNTVWRFTTRTGPLVVSTIPADGATNVPMNTTLSMTISERIEPVGNVTLYKNGAQFVENLRSCIPGGQFANVSYNPIGSRQSPLYVVLDASRGGGQLVEANKIYAHMWVKYHYEDQTDELIETVGNWGEDDGVGLMQEIGTDIWQLNIFPANSLREYFGLPLQAMVDSLGVVFRNADGSIQATPPASVEGATVMPNGDVYFPVHSGNTIESKRCMPLQFNTNYYVQAQADAFETAEGKKVSFFTTNTAWNFTTETEPVITSRTPAPNATGVGLASVFTLNFDKEVQPVTGKYLRVYQASNSQLVTTLEVTSLTPSGTGFNFSLPITLDKYNTQYYIVADANAFLRYGVAFNVLQGNTDWRFTTQAAPTVIGQSPVHQATGVDLINSVSLTFSEPVYATQNAFAQLRLADSNAQPFVISLAGLETDANNILTLSLGSTILDFNTQYEVFFDQDAFRTADFVPFSVLNSDNAWTFTTRSAPTVVSLSPAHDATNVATTQGSTYSITFSDPVTLVAGVPMMGLYPDVTYNNPTGTSQLSVSGSNPNKVEFGMGALAFATTYYLKAIEPNGNHIFQYKGRSFSWANGYPDNGNQWKITTAAAPDTQAPTIVPTTPAITFDGTTTKVNSLTVSITDDVSGVAGAKLYHRRLRLGGNFAQLPLTNSSGNSYTGVVDKDMFDEVGMEYYFTATDNAGNEARSPQGSDVYKVGYTLADSEQPTLPASVVGVGGKPENYRIFSVPYSLTTNTVSSVLGELGNPDPEKYRLLTYNKNKPDGWAIYSGDFNTIDRGKGYWLNTVDPVSITIEGVKTNPEPYTFTLQPGWNQIGNPYPFPIDWTTIKVSNTNVGNLYKFNGSYTQSEQTLNKYEGGFVFVQGSQTVTLSTASILGGSGAREAGYQEDFTNGWVLPMAIKQGAYVNDFTGVGMHPDAQISGDRFDNVTPPRFIEYLEANFAHPEHTGRTFSRDIVPTQREYTWEFTVDSNLDGPVVTFTWAYPEENDFARELFLFDVALQRPVDMRTATTYSFNPQESSSFKIYYGENFMREFNPEQVTLGQAYPNPTSGELSLTFSLPSKGGNSQQVELEMVDALGRSLGTIVRGTYAAGYHELTWNGENKLSSTGLFTYRLKVSNDQGSDVLQGKIMVKK